MYAESNRVEDNLYHDNLVGVFLMYSDGVAIRRNRISHSLGSTGMGIGFKESSEISVEDNAILYCATGIYVDISPYEPGSTNRFERNRIAYNGIGMLFHNDWTGNLLRDNRFEGNHTQVAVRGGGTAQRNVWSGNHWDDYRGFDRNGDGVGDTSYELYAYSDQLWMEFPGTQFFRGSPLLEMLDFLERLAPWSRPLLVLRDDAPILHSPGH
jgi:nitrous oxidase accessory protein